MQHHFLNNPGLHWLMTRAENVIFFNPKSIIREASLCNLRRRMRHCTVWPRFRTRFYWDNLIQRVWGDASQSGNLCMICAANYVPPFLTDSLPTPRLFSFWYHISFFHQRQKTALIFRGHQCSVSQPGCFNHHCSVCCRRVNEVMWCVRCVRPWKTNKCAMHQER